MLKKLFFLICIFLVHKIAAKHFSKRSEYALNSSVALKGYSHNYLQGICDFRMSRSHKHSHENWKCSLLNYSREKNNRGVACSCTLSYDCFDYEEYHLDLDYDSINKDEAHVYIKKCQQSLNVITNETNWVCDWVHDKYECECTRKKVCQKQKVLRFKSGIFLREDNSS